MNNGYYKQQLIHHNASLIQNKYALNVTLKLRAEEVANTDNLAKILGSKTRIYEEINFVICQSCFWCASCLVFPNINYNGSWGYLRFSCKVSLMY
jgi:hypothetical protein